jgi:hypothetical protein
VAVGRVRKPFTILLSYRALTTGFCWFPDIDTFPEIQAFFGGDSTAGGIRYQFSTHFHQDAKAFKNVRARGVDCKDITLPSLGGSG